MSYRNRNVTRATRLRCAPVFLAMVAGASAAPKLDSNWIALFNGKDLDNWYAYVSPPGGAAKTYPIPSADPKQTFRVVAGEIVASIDTSAGQTSGYLATDSMYSRYQCRVEYKFGPHCVKGLGQYCKNSGLLYHMVEDGIFGVGIECNMYWDWPTAIAGLGGVKFARQRASFGNFQVAADSMNQYTSDTGWNTMEVRVYGDSAAQHFVNGHLGGWVEGIQLSDGTPLSHGHVALQIEGNDVAFRNPVIRDLDRRVDTLGCRDPKSANYDAHATKDDGSCVASALNPMRGAHRGPSRSSASPTDADGVWPVGGPGSETMNVQGRVILPANRKFPQIELNIPSR